MGGRLSRAAGHDSDFLQPLRSGRSAAWPAVCRDVAGSPRTRRRLAQRGVRRAAILFGTVWRLSTDGIAAFGKQITPEQRARWATNMLQSAEDAGLPSDAEFRAAFVAYIEWGSRIAMENSGAGVKPPANMPVPRWWWVCNAPPGSRPTAKAGDRPVAVDAGPKLPGADEAVRFDDHIRPLFRPMDRNSMLFAFDLWKEADVAAHREQILARLRAGTMPCDGAWPGEKIALFA